MASKSKSDYAYTPDDDPSHWKLDISDKDHAAAAKAALGKGFRGNKVKIPEDARAGVIRKVNEACKRFGIDPIKTSSVHFVNTPFNLSDRGVAHLEHDYDGVRLFVTSSDSDDDLLWDEYFLRGEAAMIRAAELGFDENEVISDSDDVSSKTASRFDPSDFEFTTESGRQIDENDIDEYLKSPDDIEYGWDDKPSEPQNWNEAIDRYDSEDHGESVAMMNAGQETDEPYVSIWNDGTIEGSDGQQFSSLDDAKQWLYDDDSQNDDDSEHRTSALSVTQNDGSRVVVDDLSGAYGIILDGPTSFDYEVYDSADATEPFIIDAAGTSDDAFQDVSDALNELASQLHQIAEPNIDPASPLS